MNSHNSEKLKLLLIDDEVGVLRALALMLQASGYEVHAFASAAEGLHEVESIQPDWIISDLRMPGIDGFGVLERRNLNFPHIPFILISGHAKEAEIQRAKELGAQAILQKPFDPAELTSIIRANVRAHPQTAS